MVMLKAPEGVGELFITFFFKLEISIVILGIIRLLLSWLGKYIQKLYKLGKEKEIIISFCVEKCAIKALSIEVTYFVVESINYLSFLYACYRLKCSSVARGRVFGVYLTQTDQHRENLRFVTASKECNRSRLRRVSPYIM